MIYRHPQSQADLGAAREANRERTRTLNQRGEQSGPGTPVRSNASAPRSSPAARWHGSSSSAGLKGQRVEVADAAVTPASGGASEPLSEAFQFFCRHRLVVLPDRRLGEVAAAQQMDAVLREVGHGLVRSNSCRQADRGRVCVTLRCRSACSHRRVLVGSNSGPSHQTGVLNPHRMPGDGRGCPRCGPPCTAAR